MQMLCTRLFVLYSGAMTSLKYIRFLNALCKETQKTVVLVVDNLKVHHSRLVKRWLKKHSAKIHVFYLPAYSPELNPDELVNADLKRAIGQREPAKNKKEQQGVDLLISEHGGECRNLPDYHIGTSGG